METAKHLSKNEITQCAEAINQGTFKNIDKHLQDHISTCDKCANETSSIAMILEAEQALLNNTK